ncbi:MAG: hypothetical protein DMG25_14710 [Acidobacteria bacterium]|nr:MAG: hypothetical protein DMG25_14710 [Acidobacteriota bacterium]
MWSAPTRCPQQAGTEAWRLSRLNSWRKGGVERFCDVRAWLVAAWQGRRASRLARTCQRLLLFYFLAVLLSSFLSLAQTTSQSVEAQESYRKGVKLVQQGRPDAALQAFNRGLESDPSNLVLLNAIGATYTLKGDTEKARDCFQRVLTIDPGFVPARKNLAISYFDSRRYDLAAREFEQLTPKSDASPLAHLFLGMIAEKRKQYEAAVAQFQQAGEGVFQNSAAILSFALSLYETRQLEKSQLALKRLADVGDASAGDYYQAGLLYFKCGREDQALESFEKARQRGAELPGLDYRRALVLDKMGRTNEALEILRELAARKPDPDSLGLLGEIARRAGKLELSAEAFRKLIDIEPDREEPYLSLSALLMEHENEPLGLEVVEAGLAHIPQSYRLAVQKGAILEDLGRHEEAQRTFRSAMKRQTDHRHALIGLAVSEVYEGQAAEAVRTLAVGVKEFPNDFYIYYFYGLALRKLTGLPRIDATAVDQQARRALERSIQLNPGFADSYFLLGKLYIEKDPELAAKNFEIALRINPQHVAAKYQLGRLYISIGKQKEGQNLLSQANEQRAEMEEKPKIMLLGQ